jgi:hypothetical protein
LRRKDIRLFPPKSPARAKAKSQQVLVASGRMNSGKEFPSAGIRFPSSPSLVRLAL